MLFQKRPHGLGSVALNHGQQGELLTLVGFVEMFDEPIKVGFTHDFLFEVPQKRIQVFRVHGFHVLMPRW